MLLGKYLVITVFDGGPLTPNPEDAKNGRTVYGNTLRSPRIVSTDSLPHAGYDEWYTFAEPRKLDNPNIFVNYGGWDLRDPSYPLQGIEPTWDIVGIKYEIEYFTEVQEKFWSQLEQFSPELYIADRDRFSFATQNHGLFEAVQKVVQMSGG